MSYYRYDDEKSRKESLGTALIFLTINSLILLAIAQLLCGTLSNVFFHTAEYTSYFRIVFITAFFNAGVVLTMLTLRVQQKPVRARTQTPKSVQIPQTVKRHETKAVKQSRADHSLASMIRQPQNLRTAIILKEILDKPLALRDF